MTTMIKKRKTPQREIVAEPSPPEPSAAELEQQESVRLTSVSIDFIGRLFPESGPRRWLEVLAGEDGAGVSREVQLCNYHPEHGWTVLQHTNAREKPATLQSWIESKRLFTTVRVAPTLLAVPHDQGPRLPSHCLYSVMPVALLPHHGSGGKFLMVDRTRVAARKKALQALPLAPTFLVHSGDHLTAAWMLSEGVSVDALNPLLVKLALVTGGEPFTSAKTFVDLPGQHAKTGIIPRWEISLEEGSGRQYSLQEVREWLGTGTTIRSKEDITRDALLRAHAAGAGS